MLVELSILTKIVLYAGLLAGVGLSLQQIALGAEFRRVIIVGALLLAFCVPVRLFLLNAELAGGLQHALDFSMFDWVWTPNQAQTLAYLSGAVAMLVGVLARLPLMLIVGVLTILVGVGLGGHTRGLETPGMIPWIASLHVGLAAFWVSAPIALWPSQNIDDDVLLHRMERFSAIAIWGVPLVFAGGVWLGALLTGSFSGMAMTGYGRLLILKLVLACAALTLGGANKYWVTQKLRANPTAGRRLLRRILIVDGIIFSGIVLIIVLATTITGPTR